MFILPSSAQNEWIIQIPDWLPSLIEIQVIALFVNQEKCLMNLCVYVCVFYSQLVGNPVLVPNGHFLETKYPMLYFVLL